MTGSEKIPVGVDLGKMIKAYPISPTRFMLAILGTAGFGALLLYEGYLILSQGWKPGSVIFLFLVGAPISIVVGTYRTIRALIAHRKLTLGNPDLRTPEGRHAFWGPLLLVFGVVGMAGLINIGVVILILGVFVLGFAIYLIVRGRAKSTDGVVIYSQGLTYNLGTVSKIVRWDEISDVSTQVVYPNIQVTTVHLKDNTRFEIASAAIPNYDEIAAEISNRFENAKRKASPK